MEKAMAPHSSTLAWKMPWMEEPGGLQSMGSLRVGHDWATSLSLFTFVHWRRKWQPTPVFLPRESQGRGAWWAAVYGVAQSRTRLKWLSSSSKTNMKNFSTHFTYLSYLLTAPPVEYACREGRELCACSAPHHQCPAHGRHRTHTGWVYEVAAAPATQFT